MFDKFGLKISKIFKSAEEEMLDLNHPYVGTEHLLLAILKNDEKIASIAKKYKLTYDNLKEELISVIGKASKKSTFVLYTPLLKRVINASVEDALHDNVELNTNYLFRSIFDVGEGIAIRLLLGMGIDIDKLYESIEVKQTKKVNKNLEIINIGKDISKEIDLNEEVVGREKELELVMETLIRKNKNNPMLVGDAGVGKTAIVEELARRIIKGCVPPSLKNKKIISLELGSLVAGTKYRGEFEEKLTKIIRELEENPDIIVFIDEIHAIVNAGGAEGAINASDILKPYLARGTIKVIGATTTNEFNKYILKDKALTRRFEVIKVLEPSVEETKNILNKVKFSYEKHYDLKITKENIEDIVDLSSRYINDKKNPDKALDILDSVCAMINVRASFYQVLDSIDEKVKKLEKKKENYVKKNEFLKAASIHEEIIAWKEKKEKNPVEKKKIYKKDILDLISKKCNIPLLEKKETVIAKLEKELPKKVLGQDIVLSKIINNIKNNFNASKPLCMLLVGSSGVGKTLTVKEIANIMNMNLLRLDMSEYNLDISVNRLIGASAGYIGYNDEAIFNQIKMHPYSIILVDELEKASPAVMNLFLQIMDEGFVTNAQGEKIDFKNTYIFMTSNALGNQKIGFQKEKIDYNEYFSKEFLARFDDIITYQKITKDVVRKYLQTHNIDDENIIEKIDYEKYGLREAKKFINRKNVVL